MWNKIAANLKNHILAISMVAFVLCVFTACNNAKTSTGGSGSETGNTITGVITNEGGQAIAARIIVWQSDSNTNPSPVAIDTLFTNSSGSYTLNLDPKFKYTLVATPTKMNGVDTSRIGAIHIEPNDSVSDFTILVNTPSILTTSWKGPLFPKPIFFIILNTPWITQGTQIDTSLHQDSQPDSALFFFELHGIPSGTHKLALVLGDTVNGLIQTGSTIDQHSVHLQAGDSLWIAPATWSIPIIQAGTEPMVLADFNQGRNETNLGHFLWDFTDESSAGNSTISLYPNSQSAINYIQGDIKFAAPTNPWVGIGMHLNKEQGASAGLANLQIQALEIRARGPNLRIHPVLTSSLETTPEIRNLPKQNLSSEWSIYRWDLSELEVLVEGTPTQWDELSMKYFRELLFIISPIQHENLDSTYLLNIDWIQVY